MSEFEKRNLPRPPGMISGLLRWLRISTVEDLLALDMNTIPPRPRVTSPLKLQLLEEFRHRLATDRARPGLGTPLGVLPARGFPKEFGPGLRALGVRTIEDVLVLDPVKVFPGRRQEAFRTWQAQLAGIVGLPAPRRRAVEDLRTIERTVLECANAAHRDWVVRRLVLRHSLAAIGEDAGLSRERVRQAVERVLVDGAASVNEDLSAIFERRIAPRLLAPGLGHRAELGGLEVPFEHLGLILACLDRRWAVTGDWLTKGEALAEATAGAEALAKGRWLLPAQEVTPVARRLLDGCDGWVAAPDGGLARDAWVVDPRAWLEESVLAAGAPVHQNQVADWMMDRAHVPSRRRDRPTLLRWRRIAESRLAGCPCLYRVGPGLFEHDARIDLQALVATAVRCVDESPTGRLSLEAMVERAMAGGYGFPGLTPWLLKEALTAHPRVRPDRKLWVRVQAS